MCWGMVEVKGDVGKCEGRHGKPQQTSFNTSPTPQHTFSHFFKHFSTSPHISSTSQHTYPHLPNSQHFPHPNTLLHTSPHLSLHPKALFHTSRNTPSYTSSTLFLTPTSLPHPNTLSYTSPPHFTASPPTLSHAPPPHTPFPTSLLTSTTPQHTLPHLSPHYSSPPLTIQHMRSEGE